MIYRIISGQREGISAGFQQVTNQQTNITDPKYSEDEKDEADQQFIQMIY